MDEKARIGCVKRLKYSRRSQLDLADIAEYIADATASENAARKFIAQLKNRCGKLARLPGTLGRARDELEPGLRSVVFKSYVIFFRYIGEAVEVVTILHGMRDIDGLMGEDEEPTSSPHP